MIRGTIRPNGYPQHIHGDLHVTEPREFVVDPKAQAMVDVKGKAVVLTTKLYEELRKKSGGPIVLEPLAADVDAGAARIAELEAKVAELEAKLAEKAPKAK